jgi:hypothetical protein
MFFIKSKAVLKKYMKKSQSEKITSNKENKTEDKNLCRRRENSESLDNVDWITRQLFGEDFNVRVSFHCESNRKFVFNSRV